MFVCMCGRKALMQSIATVKSDKILELGVHRGENAVFLNQVFQPKELHLVDSWRSEDVLGSYSPFETLPPGVVDLNKFAPYFGGDLNDQTTFEKNYEAAKQALDGLDNVTIHRTDTFSAYETLKGQQFDIIYIDANHQYEYVLRDIKLFAELLTENGLIILNDAIASPMGRTQNLGVLEAVSSFLKGTHFAPLAVTATDWADLIIGRSDAIIAHVGALIALANFPKINVPPELLYAFSLVDFRGRPFIDFGSAYKEYNLHKINFEAAKKAS